MDIDRIERNVETAAKLFKALSNENRLRVICALYRGEKSARQLAEITGLSQSALSQHLARLRQDKLVGTRREGHAIYYSLHGPVTKTILRGLYDSYSRDGSSPFG